MKCGWGWKRRGVFIWGLVNSVVSRRWRRHTAAEVDIFVDVIVIIGVIVYIIVISCGGIL